MLGPGRQRPHLQPTELSRTPVVRLTNQAVAESGVRRGNGPEVTLARLAVLSLKYESPSLREPNVVCRVE